MHAEALGGGVAEFDAAVETRACPYLNELGEVALNHMRDVYVKLEDGDLDAIAELANQLAAAAAQEEQIIEQETEPEEAIPEVIYAAPIAEEPAIKEVVVNTEMPKAVVEPPVENIVFDVPARKPVAEITSVYTAVAPVEEQKVSIAPVAAEPAQPKPAVIADKLVKAPAPRRVFVEKTVEHNKSSAKDLPPVEDIAQAQPEVVEMDSIPETLHAAPAVEAVKRAEVMDAVETEKVLPMLQAFVEQVRAVEALILDSAEPIDIAEAEAKLEEIAMALFEQLQIDYEPEKVKQYIAELRHVDIATLLATKANFVDLEHDGTHEAKVHPLLNSGFTMLIQTIEQALGRLVLPATLEAAA